MTDSDGQSHGAPPPAASLPAPALVAAPAKGAFGVLTAVATVSALALALVNSVTAGPIAEAEKAAELEAVRAVLPPFDGDPERAQTSVGGRSFDYDLARGTGGAPVGVAVRSASKLGYSGTIEIVVGVTPDGTITGVKVLRHLETPGLGAKITEPGFVDQYKGQRQGSFDFRVRKDQGQVDAITGATISSRAVSEAVVDALRAHASIPGLGATP